ncbi:DUF3352 domain-containing protein [Acaryochloris marina]|uniref:DUF3352 domain-containing protein n=1 Tax=Acaryochloris marina (strain MBIC 11017) TaxID=329726 RepID=B0C9X5_ACAM1|nr:DUF3352 domain-containing protein [Acaryochloris marina]ABW25415.1 hypothetical protein AM1_0356 [Acaryochloris marina MBIC11017]
MVKLRSVFLQLLASVLALLIWSGPVWALEPEPELAPPQPEPELGPESAHFMPDTTSLMVSLTGSPLKMAGNESAGASSQLTDLPATLLATGGIDYQKDIRPWVSDEMTFALTSLEKGQPGYLLAVKTRNNRDADAFLERIWQQQATDGQTINFERYAGVDLISADMSPNVATSARLPGLLKPVRYLTTAKLDDRFVLIANQRQVLEQAVDSSKKPATQLAKRSEYKTAIASLTQKQQSGMAYLDLEKLLPAISGQAATTPPTYRSLGIAFGESRQGLLAETALVAKAGRDLPAVKTTQQEPMAALSYFPGNSPFVVSGSNLGTLWSQINQDLQGYPNLKSWVNQTLGTWGKTHGLNLTSKIFPWVDGDYAWALLPDSLSPVLSAQANSEADWLFAYEQTNSDKNKQLATHLNELATEQDLGTSPFELAGRKVYAWTRLVSQEIDDTRGSNLTFKTEVTGAYANIDNQKILASSPEALGLALDAGSDALTNQRSFQDAIAPFDQPNQGFLYIDWPVMKPILKKNLPVISKLESNAQTLLSKLRSVSISSYGETSEVQHSQWYFRF